MLSGNHIVELLVLRITAVAGEGKVKIIHQNLLLPFGGNIEENSEDMGKWQGVNRPPDCILAASDEGVPETEVVSADPGPEGEDDAICVQCVQPE